MNITKLVTLPRLFADLTRRCVLGGGSLHRLASTNTSRAKKANEADEEDTSLYQKEYSNKARFLEQVGMVKPHISWPRYNRIIYPPSDTGEPIKNPVSLGIFFDLTRKKNGNIQLLAEF